MWVPCVCGGGGGGGAALIPVNRGPLSTGWYRVKGAYIRFLTGFVGTFFNQKRLVSILTFREEKKNSNNKGKWTSTT